MSRNGSSAVVKQDRSTLYGVFAILALLPTAFSVAFEFQARGITSGRPWLTALFPLVLLIAARFIPTVWHRSRIASWTLIAVVMVSAGLFCWHLSGLLSFLGVTSVMRFIAPAVIAVMYTAFAIVVGRLRARPGSTGTRPAAGSVADAEGRIVARRRESITR